MSWLPIEGVTLRSSVGLLHTELGSFQTVIGNGVVTIPSGNQLPNAAKLTFNQTVGYEFPVDGGAWRLGAQAQAHYSDGVFAEALNTWYLNSPANWLLDARMALSSGNHHQEITLWGKNLANKQYPVQETDDGFGSGYRIFNTPRTYGMSYLYRW